MFRPVSTSSKCGLSLLAGVAIAALVEACSGAFPAMPSLSGATVSRHVLDFDTRTPLGDVQAMAIYTAESGIGHSETVCYRIENMVTGADGRYEFPAGRYRGPLVELFKRGYSGVPNPRYVDQRWVVVDGKDEPRFFAVEVDRNKKPLRILWEKVYPTRAEAEVAARVNERYMKPFTGTREQRFEELWPYVTSSSCDAAADQWKKQVPYLTAIYMEVKDLAVTKDQANMVELVRYRIARAKPLD